MIHSIALHAIVLKIWFLPPKLSFRPSWFNEIEPRPRGTGAAHDVQCSRATDVPVWQPIRTTQRYRNTRGSEGHGAPILEPSGVRGVLRERGPSLFSQCGDSYSQRVGGSANHHRENGDHGGC